MINWKVIRTSSYTLHHASPITMYQAVPDSATRRHEELFIIFLLFNLGNNLLMTPIGWNSDNAEITDVLSYSVGIVILSNNDGGIFDAPNICNTRL